MTVEEIRDRIRQIAVSVDHYLLSEDVDRQWLLETVLVDLNDLYDESGS